MPRSGIPCPFCGSADTVREADFGTSVMMNRQYCRGCRTHFEAIKWGAPTGHLDLPDFLKPHEPKEPSHG